jgi:hypothetical protein
MKPQRADMWIVELESTGGGWTKGSMTASVGGWWTVLCADQQDLSVHLGADPFVLARDLGDVEDFPSTRATVKENFPYWPNAVIDDLSTRGVSGGEAGVVFCTRLFADILRLSAVPFPILFPDAVHKLELASLHEASQGMTRLLDGCATLPEALRGIPGLETISEGRLLGEVVSGHVTQLDPSLTVALEGVTAPPVSIMIDAPPLAASFGPAEYSDDELDGRGLVVTEVAVGGAFHVHGVQEGWRLSRFNGVDVRGDTFWDIDALFDTPPPWALLFETATPAANLYAVELPAKERTPPLLSTRMHF